MDTTTTAPAATKTETTFRLEYAVRATIRATPAAIWRRLADAAAFPTWNSTVTRIDGTIALGERLALRVSVAPERTFKLRVTAFEPDRRMVWSDGTPGIFRGDRTFTLTPNADGTTEFAMSEVLRGAMLPMIKSALPDFRPVFDQYIVDLKRAAEAS